MRIAFVEAERGDEARAAAVLAESGAEAVERISDEALEELRRRHGITHEEESRLDEGVPAEVYEQIARAHHYEGVAATLLVRKGCARFTVQCAGGAWVRVEVGEGDLLHLPPGARHTFERVGDAALECTGLTAYDPAKVEPQPVY